MITVKCDLKDNNFYSLVDEEFLKANMKKVDKGKYIGDGDTFCSSFFAIKALLKNKNFVEAINTFTRDCDNGDGEEDILEFYEYLVSNGRI